MKYFKLMIWVMAIAMIFFSCSKDNIQTTDDQVASSFKAKPTTTDFTGTSIPLVPPGSDPNVWYDDAIDEVTGITIWVTEGAEFPDPFTIKFWGTAELFVGAEEIGDDYEGKWEMKFWGTQIFEDPGYPETGPFEILAYAGGVGTEGDVKGMFAEWTYTMDTDVGFFYATEGYIAPKQMTKTLKTIKASGPFEIIYPSADCGPYPQMHILGNGNCSHLGKFDVENEACFYIDEYENIIPVGVWEGKITAANGDMIYTHLIYSWEVDGLDYYLYDIYDGTGRFEDASGYIENWGRTEYVNPANPFLGGTWNLEGFGIIVY